jgi:hypothetical protein
MPTKPTEPTKQKESVAFSVTWGDSPAAIEVIDVCEFTAVWGSPSGRVDVLQIDARI